MKRRVGFYPCACGHVCHHGYKGRAQCCHCSDAIPNYAACGICQVRIEVPPVGTHRLDPKTRRHLLLDLDTAEAVRQFVEHLPTVENRYGLRGLRIWPSKSKGTHSEVELVVAPKDHLHTCFLQMFLGSDPVREWLNHTQEQHNLLFKPDVMGRVEVKEGM